MKFYGFSRNNPKKNHFSEKISEFWRFLTLFWRFLVKYGPNLPLFLSHFSSKFAPASDQWSDFDQNGWKSSKIGLFMVRYSRKIKSNKIGRKKTTRNITWKTTTPLPLWSFWNSEVFGQPLRRSKWHFSPLEQIPVPPNFRKF